MIKKFLCFILTLRCMGANLGATWTKGKNMLREPKYKKDNEILTDRFVRDERLMKVNLLNTKPLIEERKRYSEQINSNEELKDIESGYSVRLNKQKYKNEKRQEKTSDLVCVLIISFFMAAGISVSNHFYEYLPKEQQQVTKKDKAGDLTIITIFAIIGAVISFVFADRPKKQWDTKNVDEFYNRLIVRYFDKLHDKTPEITENALLTFNPELARVVYALLVANLSKQDIAKLDSLALTMADELETKVFGNELRFIDNQMRQATNIVERALMKRSELQNIIKDAYRGKIPATFYITNQGLVR